MKAPRTDPHAADGARAWLPRHRVAALLNPHLLDLLKIEAEHEVATVRASRLLTPSRIDVMAKYLYARCRVTGRPSRWATHVYREHLRVWNDFREEDRSGKSSFEDFRGAFDELLDDVGRTGFDERRGLVPVGRDDLIIDGSHRLAAALALDRSVDVVRFDVSARRYDAEFFGRRGIGSVVLDDMVLAYCRLDPRVRVAVLFPIASGHDAEATAILGEAGAVVHEKSVVFHRAGRANLIRLLYRNEPWLGAGDAPTPGLLAHVENRFVEGKPVTFVFFLGGDRDASREIKDRIRALYDLGNDPIHINDTHAQTVAIGEAVLNPNGIHHLNHARPATFRRFSGLLNDMKSWIAREGLDREGLCVDGSAVLAAYGLREVRDLDFLHLGAVSDGAPALVSSHNEEAHHYDRPVDDLITDPRNYFYRDGVKFLALHVVRDMKDRRGEAKDRADVYRIEGLEGRVGPGGRWLERYHAMRDRLTALHFTALSRTKKLIPPALVPAAKAVYHAPRRIRDAFGPDENATIYRGFELHFGKGMSLLDEVRGGRVYEPDLSRRLVQALRERPAPMLFDVGADIGLVTLNVLAEIPEVRVVAFEPGPHQARLFEKTIEANHLEDRVTLVREALGRTRGRADFAVHSGRHAARDGFLDTRRAGPVQSIDVPTTTLDVWWRSTGEPQVDAVKIAAEGAELWVLEGAEAMLRARHPVIVFELHPANLRVYPYGAAEILAFLEAHGYTAATLAGTVVEPGGLDRHMRDTNHYVATHGS